jgi:hypothetical protein
MPTSSGTLGFDFKQQEDRIQTMTFYLCGGTATSRRTTERRLLFASEACRRLQQSTTMNQFGGHFYKWTKAN